MGIQRQLQHCPKRAAPITPAMLLKFHDLLDLADNTHIAFWALFTTAFFTMARKSNLVITPAKDSPDHFILRNDISLTHTFATITFRSSKTNQFGIRHHSVPLFKALNSPLCPVSALNRMFNQIPMPNHSAAFVLPNNKPITYYMFNSFLKYLIRTIGLNPSDYSTHSFRRGGATFAFQSNVPAELIKHHGDWKSDAYLVYLQYDFPQKMSVSKRMSLNI